MWTSGALRRPCPPRTARSRSTEREPAPCAGGESRSGSRRASSPQNPIRPGVSPPDAFAESAASQIMASRRARPPAAVPPLPPNSAPEPSGPRICAAVCLQEPRFGRIGRALPGKGPPRESAAVPGFKRLRVGARTRAPAGAVFRHRAKFSKSSGWPEPARRPLCGRLCRSCRTADPKCCACGRGCPSSRRPSALQALLHPPASRTRWRRQK